VRRFGRRGHIVCVLLRLREDIAIVEVGASELVREEPEITQHLLAILSAKVAQTKQVRKALLMKEEAPAQHVGLA
jgi:hypothetical protein